MAREPSELAVLLVEDNPADARLVAEMLKDTTSQPIAVSYAVRLEEALGRLQDEGFSVVLLDLSLPDSQGIDTFVRARSRAPHAPIVVLTGLADEEVAATAVREGAQDYLVKGQVDGPLLYRSIRYAVERHATESALRKSESRYRTLIEGSIQGILIHSDDVIQLANQALADLIGVERADTLVGTSVWQFVAPVDRPRLAEYTRARLAGDPAPDHYQFRGQRLDGTVIWLDCLATVVPWEESTAILATLVDVTDRKRALDDLRASEERFRQLAENIKEAFIVIDVPSFAPVFLSRMWSEITGRGLDDAQRSPESWFDAIHPDDRAAVRASQGAVARGEAAVDVYRIVRPDRSVRWVRARVFPVFDDDGVVYRMVGLVEDITEFRFTEEQLRQAQKMEAVGRLAGGVAHDFNNLLTAIIGYADLVLGDLGADHPVAQDIEQIRAAGQSAAGLTRQLLAFSRRQILQPQTVNLNAVLQRVESLLRRIIGEDIVLNLKLAETSPVVTADPGQIEQAVMNLAVNARDAMPQGGSLTIETAVVDLDEAYAHQHPTASMGLHVMLTVSDSGVGMDEETQKRLFEPFFTTKDVGKGTGLGLATVYGIVKQSHGSIWVYSELDKGSTFKIYLPLSTSEAVALGERAPRVGSWSGTETILVLEDKPEARSVIRETLRRRGYHIVEASDGHEALALSREYNGPIHLLLTDVVMAGLSGRQVAELLQAERPGLRVMYMSGYTDDTIVRHGVLEPGLAFLQKPFTSESLLRKIRDTLDAGESPRV